MGERLVAEVGKRRPAPERERVVQQLHALRRGRVTRFGDECLESFEVECALLDMEHVARRPRLDGVAPESLAQLRHGVVQRRERSRRRLLSPQLAHEPLRCDDVVGVEKQERENRPLSLSRYLDGTAVARDLERPEDPELEHVSLVTRSGPVRIVVSQDPRA